jgi:hypothetical protein
MGSRPSGPDENGDEIPVPDDARLTVRWLRGKVLLVAKGSLWNGDPAAYDGRHNGMTAAQIRITIERSLAKMMLRFLCDHFCRVLY